MANILKLGKGTILPDLQLPATTGERVRLVEFRGRRNLVLFLSHPPGCVACEQELRELSHARGELGEETEVLAVVPGQASAVRELEKRLALSLPVLIDADRTLGDGASMVVTDRFGEIFAVTRSGEKHRLPSLSELAEELAFIEVQCPE